MNQAELASSVGVSFQQVQKYERGINAIEESRLRRVCEALGLAPDFFADDTGLIGQGQDSGQGPDAEAAINEDIQRFVASDEGQRLIRSFLSIANRRFRAHVVDFIVAVAANDKALSVPRE